MRLDLKDRKLLFALEKNARSTHASLAKIVSLSKDAVAYRLRRLEHEGLIKGYRAIINIAKTGYLTFRVYMQLMDMPQAALDEMIAFLKSDQQTWWIARLDGSWDFLFAYHARSHQDFHDFYRLFASRFRKYVKTKLISPVTSYQEIPRRYLVPEEYLPSVRQSASQVTLDAVDERLLMKLAVDGRIRMLDLAKAVGVDVKTAKSRIRRLEKEQVILGYKVDIDVGLLGRDFYTVEIDLNDYEDYAAICQELLSYKETTSWVEAIGSYDIECDMEIEASHEFYQITNDLKKKYAAIREIRYFRIVENYKIQYIPDLLHEAKV